MMRIQVRKEPELQSKDGLIALARRHSPAHGGGTPCHPFPPSIRKRLGKVLRSDTHHFSLIPLNRG